MDKAILSVRIHTTFETEESINYILSCLRKAISGYGVIELESITKIKVVSNRS